jgi:signal transduction histidine kinase
MDFFRVAKRNRVTLVLAIMAALATVLISEAAYWRSVDRLTEVGEMAVARLNIQRLERSLLDAETGQRGYLLTQRKEYLQPYEESLKNIMEYFKRLDDYYGDEAFPKAILLKMHALVDTKLSELALTLRLHDEGKPAAMSEVIMSGIGKEHMDSFRVLAGDLLKLESDKVSNGRQEIYYMLMLGRVGVALLTTVSLLALFMYLRKRFAHETLLVAQQRMVQAERDRLEVEVTERTAMLTQLALHLHTAREDERSRLARNLHDDLGALLTSAKLDAARIKSRLADTTPEASKLLVHLVENLNNSIALGRRIIEDLRPSALSNLGLMATLEIMTDEFTEQSGIEVHRTLEAVPLSPTSELMVYRLVQEAITNITKYARASQVWVCLTNHDGRIELSVRDDGVGFDTAAKRTSAHGLLGMRFRVEAEGGTLAVISEPNHGTLIRVTLPKSSPV